MRRWFNLTDEERKISRNKRMFCIIIYDISNNKRRYRFKKLLEGYGIRVQRSCFEVSLTPNIYKSLINDISKFYNSEEEDNIIVYRGDEGLVNRYSTLNVIQNNEYYQYI